MSQRDGQEWRPIKFSFNPRSNCDEEGCGQEAMWEKTLISCDKSSYDGGIYCEKHSAEQGNLAAQGRKGSEKNIKYVVIVGNLISGILSIHGPFGGKPGAMAWALDHVVDVENCQPYVVVQIEDD